MAYTLLTVEKKDRVAKLTLNRPEAMNACNKTLEEEFVDALNDLERDDEVDVVILTGNGRAFCAGRDLKELGANPDRIGNQQSMFVATGRFPKPLIAAVNGFAITGGMELALNCDIIIASENAKFADTHARVGIMPGAGMSQILPRLVGIKKAKELSFTGNFLTAQEAWQYGLVNKVVPPEELMPAAEKTAKDILSSDQVVVRKMKRLIDRGEGLPFENALMLERYEQLLHRQTLAADTVERRRQAVTERGRSQTGD